MRLTMATHGWKSFVTAALLVLTVSAQGASSLQERKEKIEAMENNVAPEACSEGNDPSRFFVPKGCRSTNSCP